MAWDINQVVLVGRLTSNPVLRYSAQGNAYCQLGLAVGMRPISGSTEDQVSFFNVMVFGKVAEVVCEYVSKGKQIAVNGYLRQRRWEKDGQKFNFVDVMADRVQFLSPSSQKGDYKEVNQENSFKKSDSKEDYQENNFDEDNIPF